MRTIPKTYNGRGDQKPFTFTLVKREGDIALYKKEGEKGGCWYEVVVVQRFKASRVMRGEVINEEGDEFLPTSRQWGSKGWTFFKKSDAENKMNVLVEREKNKKEAE